MVIQNLPFGNLDVCQLKAFDIVAAGGSSIHVVGARNLKVCKLKTPDLLTVGGLF